MKLFDVQRDADCPICICAAQERSSDQKTLRTYSGWGKTRLTARKKCVLESQERLAAVWSDDIPTTLAPFSDLADVGLNPSNVTLLSDAQYLLRDQWNASVDPEHQHPAPFDPQRPIHWIQGVALAGDAPVFVPAASVYLGYPHALEEGFTKPDSNGLAAGISPEDALERALLEVLERDAVSIWWYNALPKPPIALSSTELSCAMSDWLRRQERELALLELTHDFDVPVVAAVSFSKMGADISIGFGAGRSMAAAVDAALGEMAQFDLTKRMAKSNGEGGHSSPFLSNLARLSRRNAPFIFPFGEPVQRRKATLGFGDLIAQFQRLAPETAVYVYPATDVSVLRVVAPGLRPIWPRFATGRLYSVPVEMGWRCTPAKETSLNPLPILY